VTATVDAHAHHVPDRLLRAVRRDAGNHGIAATQDDAGRWLIQLGQGAARTVPPPLVDAQACLDQMDIQEVAVRILSGWNETFGYELDGQTGAWWCGVQNDALAEFTAEHSQRLTGLAAVPLQDPARAAAELRRAVPNGLRGALIGTHVRGANLDAPELDVFWQAACELDVPVVVHPGSASIGLDRMSGYFLANIAGNPLETTVAAASLIFGGVIGRFPELHILLVHGGGFLPYQIGRLQKGFQVRPEVAKDLVFEPTVALRRFYYDSIVHSPEALAFLVTRVGPERVLFGTDFPFEMAEQRSADEWLRVPAVGDDVLRAVAGENAAMLFSLST
jgi:aminocarboxymuconate-semialdehyde decarboxylase